MKQQTLKFQVMRDNKKIVCYKLYKSLGWKKDKEKLEFFGLISIEVDHYPTEDEIFRLIQNRYPASIVSRLE